MNPSPNKVAVVTGAGSGVGQAVCWALAKHGWKVAAIARRPETLEETIRPAADLSDSIKPFICDVGSPAEVAAAGLAILEQLGPVEVLVNAAGTNIPKRSLAELSPADYERVIATNLHGPYYCTQAFLPGMRQRKSGTIVNIVSDAAKQASPKAGPSYSMSKAGLVGLTQAINAEERANGIRACAVLPGDIATPLLDKRPAPPSMEAREKMLQPDDIAECVLLAINLPPRALVEEILIRPR
jgi:NAD(P)-dependent dehydrogenase (short-subunit alcohol dehydrogenase family)